VDFNLVAETSFWANPASYFFIAQVAIGLGIVIFVHELGHFLVAKACGVKCEKFLIGFDAFDIKIAGKVIIPRKLVSWKWGETEYALGIIPLGGYVKMLGQDDNPSKAAEEIERAKIRKQAEKEEGNGDKDQDPEKTDSKGEYELDPRSYQAKSVPQRMAIISAGVIMNIIFGVIFATIAVLIGIPFTPTEVGSVVPGGPAWKEDVRPAHRVVVMGEGTKETEKLRFMDFRQGIAVHGDEEPIRLRFRAPDGTKFDKYVLPRTDVYKLKGVELPMIGMSPATSTRLGKDVAVIPTLPAAQTGKFKPSDQIITLDGKKITNSRQLKEYLTLNAGKPIVMGIKRSKKDSSEFTLIDIEVPPNPMRRLGLAMKIGTISAIQEGSPAKGKLEVGDLILSVDGEPIGNLVREESGDDRSSSAEAGLPVPNPILLSNYLQEKARAEEGVTIRVMRTVGELKQEFKDVKIQPRLPFTSPSYGGMGHPISIDELGIAVPILNWVAAVEPGSAAEGKLQPGDKITKVEFRLSDKWKNNKELEPLQNLETPIDLVEESNDWPRVHSKLQMLPPDTTIKLIYLRDGKQKTAELEPQTDGGWGRWYNPTRGIYLEPLEETLQAESLGEAVSFGLAQTGNDATRVFRFLRKLVTGQISPTNLGGPGTIVVAATSEASVSFSRLLLFFTLLSANLAIVNFLPIPVLDGGHMVFLIYELIFRKPPNEKVFMGLTLIGFAFILSLMLFVIGLDVFRFANWF